MKKALSIILSVLIIITVLPIGESNLTAKAADCGLELSFYRESSNIEDNTFSIDIRINKNTGFRALGLEIGYDSELVELVSVEKIDIQPEIDEVGATSSSFNANPFIIYWAFVTDDNITYTGDIATLTFNLKTPNHGCLLPFDLTVGEAWDSNKAPVVVDAVSDTYMTDTNHIYNSEGFCKICGVINSVTTGTTGDCIWTLDGTVLTISGNGAMEDYSVYCDGSCNPLDPDDDLWMPTICGGCAINTPWYYYDITEIIIEDSVTSIGEYAFYDCDSLTSVTIGDSVTSIGSSAFSFCTSLTSITIPNSVTSIGNNAFEYCRNLTSITIPDSVTSIGYGAFFGCSSLTSVSLGDSVTSIGEYAFSSTGYYNNSNNWENGVLYIGNHLIKAKTSISGSYEIKAGTVTIADYAFYNCSSLTSLTIPGSVTSIGAYAFANCESLTDVYYGGTEENRANISISSGNTCLTNATWHYTENDDVLTGTTGDCTWTLDGTVLTISGNGAMEDYHFVCDGSCGTGGPGDHIDMICDGCAYDTPWYCCNIVEVIIEEGVTRIGSCAFADCSSLTSVTIPESVTDVGLEAFYNCPNLTDVYYSGTVNDKSAIAIGNGNDCLIGATWHYTGTTGECTWKLDGTVLTISGNGDMADYGLYCDGSCLDFDDMGMGCSGCAINTPWYYYDITEIIIEDSVTSIGDYAFSCCSSLTSVSLPDSVTSIGSSAFSGCPSLTSITIPDSVTSIGDDAFYYCTSLTSVSLGDSVTSIGDYAFKNCSSLTSINIPNRVTSIGERAFYNCSSLTSINVALGNSNYSSDNGVLFNKNKTTLICYPAGKINTSYTIPDSVTSIGSSAFYNCSSLTSVTIPDSVTSIGAYAFTNCASLTDIYYGGTEEDRANISISSGNTCLTNATWHYTENDDILTGRTGDCTWTLDGTVLTISGNGAMENYVLCWCEVLDEEHGEFDECENYFAPWGTNITEVIIEEGVTKIGEVAFWSCYSLESVSLPESITDIGCFAFSGCGNLVDVHYSGTVNDKSNISIAGENGCLLNATWHFNSCIGAKDHTYTNVCDTTCNVCGELRTVPHYYDNDCDADCNVCGEIRYGVDHSFESSDDLVCDTCGMVRYISYSTVNNKITITDCDPSLSGIITIPATIKGKPVTAIDNNAFYECAYITGIILPDGLLTIGNNAFAYCTSLTGMNIPASVISIANNAFAHSTMFAEIVVNSNNDTYSSVDGVLFNKTQTTLFIYPAGKADKEYIIPDTVTVISENAFLKCGNLTSVVVPNGVTTLAKQTFYYCQNLVNVVLSENLTSIGDSAFYYCRSLKNIVVPSKVTSIGSMAFFYCSALSSVTLPKNIQTISSNAFGNCPFLKNVYYLGSESEAAQISINSNNASLLSATWHYNSCVGSAVHTFDDCYDTVCNCCNATRQVTHDYDNACDTTCNVCGLVRQVPNHVYDNLCDTTCNVCGATRTVPHYYDNACDSTCNVCGITRDVPNHFYDSDYDSICNVCGVIRTVTGKTGQCDWSLTGTVLTLSGNGIMADYDSADEVPWGHEITEVIISSGVVYIGKNAFTNSTELTSITIPDTVEYVSGSAFKNTGYYNNPSNWENKVLYLGKYLIKAEASISGNYTVKDGTVSIAKSAFSGCNELTSISMSDSVKFLGSGAFYYCQKLTSVELSSELKSINKNTFYCCSSLESIVIPSNVAEIGDMAFFYCSKLSFVTLPKDVSVIGSTAFASCPQLRTVYYRGSESDAENISINSNNTSILSATWYYNSCIGSEKHTFDDCYDTLCDICAETREVSHVYDNVCDDECNECGDLRDVPDHVYGDWIIDVNATCETAGAKHRECIHCGEIENAVISALNHEYNVVVTNPDCENQGYTTYSCVRCNYSYKADYTPPTGHTEVIDEAVPPTCTEKGLTEGKHCSVCNKVLVAQTEVDKLGHNYNAVVTKPTPEEQGYTTYTCTRCGDSYVDDYLPALGYDGEITFTNVVAGKGKIIRIKASVKDNPGINTFTFNVKYDQSVLTLNEVIVDESIGGNVFVNKNILWWSPEDVVFNGEFVELVFTVNENAELGDTSVTFEYTSGNVSNSNEDVINFKIASSTVSVVEYVAGDINGDGMLTGQDLTRLYKHLANVEGTVVNEPTLDLNNDGYVNAKDLTRLMRYLSGEEIEIY